MKRSQSLLKERGRLNMADACNVSCMNELWYII